ncbi:MULTISPECIES: iron-sulfur cluster assembly accessory protein [unclassified Xanthobacter]|uniref:iron-sulfur cluster assembly accessory protein n=1 Tax=unclassified Xanthobacter TaxID=2623496 RepID=UPI001EDFA0B9|nr:MULTISPECIES: iron-sulfur cluster assembly accessory protein [unclassified Xanthobacter]
MVSLSTDAALAVRAAMSAAGPAAHGLRLVAHADDDAVLTVMIHLDVARHGDVVLERSGVRLLLDGVSHRSVEGLRIDFVTAPGVPRFVVGADHAARGAGVC